MMAFLLLKVSHSLSPYLLILFTEQGKENEKRESKQTSERASERVSEWVSEQARKRKKKLAWCFFVRVYVFVCGNKLLTEQICFIHEVRKDDGDERSGREKIWKVLCLLMVLLGCFLHLPLFMLEKKGWKALSFLFLSFSSSLFNYT
jgi:hypothetical protein